MKIKEIANKIVDNIYNINEDDKYILIDKIFEQVAYHVGAKEEEELIEEILKICEEQNIKVVYVR